MRLRMAGAGSAAVVALTAALTLSAGGAAHAVTSADGTAQVGNRADATDSAVPSPGQVTLDVLSINGSGCPAGTARVSMSGDNTAFSVTYTDFMAQAGGAAAATDFRKNCQVGVQVNIPSGFTFAIARADYSGRAGLTSGASALLRTNYYFQGTSGDNYVDHYFNGPMSGTWHASDVTDASTLVYEPCGATAVLNVNTELRLSAAAGGASNWMSMGASDGSVDTIVHFQWLQC